MYYGQSLLQPGEWIITKEIPKTVDGNKNVLYVWSWPFLSLPFWESAATLVNIIDSFEYCYR